MSEYVLAALVKCPLTPLQSQWSPHRQQWFHIYTPHIQHQEAKTSAYECDSSYLEVTCSFIQAVIILQHAVVFHLGAVR